MLHSKLKENSLAFPEKRAVIDSNQFYSYGTLWSDINKTASWINENTQINSRIGVLLDNSYSGIVLIYGIMLANRICIPLDTDIHERNLGYILEDAEVKLIATSSKYLIKIERLEFGHTINFLIEDHDVYPSIKKILEYSKKEVSSKMENTDTSTPAMILYTTGTTGPQKGVMLDHQHLLAATKNINLFMQIGSDTIESLPMRLSHSFGFARLRCVFEVGGTVILEKGFLRPERILHNMSLYNANAISSVPTGFSILLDYFKTQFKAIGKNIAHIEIGSAFMRESYKRELMAICPQAKICMHYGLTEASRSTFIEFHSESEYLHTVGRPSPNVDIKIMSEEGVILPNDQIGEIYVKGPMVMRGYLGKDKLTKNMLDAGWLKTGDIGKTDESGYLHLMGRKKDVINVGGLKVAPGEVEEVLLSHKDVVEVVVMGIESHDDLLGEVIKTFIVSPNEQLKKEELENHCMEHLEPYKIPSDYVFVTSIPKTSSGKIKRHLLN
jgi:long-chain acyl-CoA synthetase